MTSRELIWTIIARQPAPRCGFWLGNPFPDTWPILYRYLKPVRLRFVMKDADLYSLRFR